MSTKLLTEILNSRNDPSFTIRWEVSLYLCTNDALVIQQIFNGTEQLRLVLCNPTTITLPTHWNHCVFTVGMVADVNNGNTSYAVSILIGDVNYRIDCKQLILIFPEVFGDACR